MISLKPEQDEESIARIRENRFSDPVMLVASGLGIGWVSPAPGTLASLVAGVLYWLLVSPASYMVQIAITVMVCLLALLVLELFVRKYGYIDARQVVIDEIAGVTIALLLLPQVYWVFVLAFVLFRVFDIWKPFPIGWIDKSVKSGLGILLDDLVAGGMACVIAYAIWKIVVDT